MLRYVLFCFTILLCTCARAQIVNIEDKRKGFDTLGWYGQLDLGGTLTKNNNTVVTLNGGLRLDQVGLRHRWLILGDYKLVQVSGDNAVNAGFGHLRYAYYLGEKWRWETFTQVQYNEQLRLNFRYLLGSGPRYRLLAKDRSRMYLGVLYMYEYDEIAEGEFIYRDHRLSTYLSFSVNILRNCRMSNTTYYQPVLPDFNQPRLSSVTTLSVPFTPHLALNVKYSITHDSRLNEEVPDVPTTTFQWVNGLRWTF